MNQLPKKITPCSIASSVCELRFTSAVHEDAIFGIVYPVFQEEFPEIEKLPVLELPASIRANDPSLEFEPHYKIKSDSFSIQIGPKSFSLTIIGDYIGWDVFKIKLVEIFDKVAELNVFSSEQVTRLGLRYINIFPDLEILKDSRITLSLGDESLLENKLDLTVVIPSEKATTKLKVINAASMVNGEGQALTGSIIDIDVALNPQDFSSYEEMIEHAHDTEKKLFFSTLSEEFISTLNPEY